MRIINPIKLLFLTKLFSAILFSAILLSGCALDKPSNIHNAETNEALSILQQIESINREIKTCKGSGWITISDGKQIKKFRMAWAASFPDKIRLTLLSAGHPVETILADGKTVTFISHTGKHETKKINSANPSLQDVVSIPVTIQDILSIFAGRVPIGKFDTASIAQITDSSALTDTMLILKRRWNGQSQNIVLTSDNKVASFSLINENRKLIHRVFNEKFKTFGSFLIPSKVKIKDDEERMIEFEITNYQPNITVRLLLLMQAQVYASSDSICL
ncbi:MAG: hypothetical protein HQK67_12475 [Desulfamplus sp.]|nr:hypothetical protein [Desulfamplus sp.]